MLCVYCETWVSEVSVVTATVFVSQQQQEGRCACRALSSNNISTGRAADAAAVCGCVCAGISHPDNRGIFRWRRR